MKQLLQVATAVLLTGTAAVCAAQSSPRAGKWEFTLTPQYTESWSANGRNGSRIEVDQGWGFGLGLAYNFNDHFALGGEFIWSEADYDLKLTPGPGNPNGTARFSTTLHTSTLRLNGTFNLLSSAFTPFITAGAGATYANSNIPDGPPQTYCWYDPWYWNYVCTTGYPTKNDTYFSYMGGIGLRWDSPGSFFIRGLAAKQWIDIGGGIGTQDVTQYRIDIGFKF